MATTLSTKFHIGNYSSAPTIDVEIDEDPATHCETCSGELAYEHPGRLDPWTHVDGEPTDGHRGVPARRCVYCRHEGTTTTTQHAWHDSTDCSDCGGSHGYAIGD